MWGWDPVTRDHRLSSLDKPCDAKRRSSGRIFLSWCILIGYSPSPIRAESVTFLTGDCHSFLVCKRCVAWKRVFYNWKVLWLTLWRSFVKTSRRQYNAWKADYRCASPPWQLNAPAILAWEFVTRSCLKLQNPCSNYEIHVLFEHGFYLKRPKLGTDLYAWRYTGQRCGRDRSFRQCFRSRKRCTCIYDVEAT